MGRVSVTPAPATAASAGAVDKTVLDANSVLYAVTDDTPAALAVAASRIVGRKASGNIVALTAAEVATIVADAAIPWIITLNAITSVRAATGTWGSSVGSNIQGGGYYTNSSKAQNDQFSFANLLLSAGTWRIDWLTYKGPDQGVWSVQIDDVEVGTFDAYAGAGTYNNAASVTGITVATTALHVLAFKALTKNASSTAYQMLLHGGLSLTRTA